MTGGVGARVDYPQIFEVPSGAPVAWGTAHRTEIMASLESTGVVLLRGGACDAPEVFRAWVEAVLGTNALDYTERSSPRKTVGDRVFTSTEYKADRQIFLHNEQSYNLVFPRFIAFGCVQPAERGGETPFADTRAIYRRIDPAIRDELARRKYCYRRNFDGRFGLSWQTTFQAADPDVIERYCADNQIELEWPKGRGRWLRTWQVREMVARHPSTGERCWFNHFTFFHLQSQEPVLQKALLAAYPDGQVPHSTFWGDGAEVDAEVVRHLQEAYKAETRMFPWQAGDIMVLDNMLACHGRNPFEGQRQLLTVMAGSTRWADCLPK